MNNIAVSPCSNPEMTLQDVLQNYSRLGYTQLELFTSWAKSAVDITEDPQRYLDAAAPYGMTFSSLHLPQIDESSASLDRAIAGARFASALGARQMLFKAKTRELYIESAKSFLDATEHLNVVPVLQNHKGKAISTLNDFETVLAGINDSRIKTLFEVGQFHAVGVSWKEGYELLQGTIALVHIKDQIGAQSVPFGTGEIDLPGLFGHMKRVGYRGNYVVEMEVADKENTLRYLREAYRYVQSFNSN